MATYIDMTVAPPAHSVQRTESIKLYGPDAFAGMRRAGALTAQCLDEIAAFVGVGTPLAAINDFVLEFARLNNAQPATLGYQGYDYAAAHPSITWFATGFRLPER